MNSRRMSGTRFAMTHQASVDAILMGKNRRRVISTGDRFANMDRWPLRHFVVSFCSWVSRNPGGSLRFSAVRDMCVRANQEASKVQDPHIRIASTPEELPWSLAMALIGGAYHEAWHTLYSRRSDLDPQEMMGLLSTVWDKMPSHQWAPMSQFILEWSNLIEDIRIERNGCRAFPGAEGKMPALQDFILEQEEEARNAALLKGAHPEQLSSPLQIISCMFRDLGLGYRTTRQDQAFSDYRKRNPEACLMVERGPLASLLEESIHLDERDDTGNLRLAMQVAVTLWEASSSEKQKQKQDSGGSSSKKQKVQCPNCGSPKVKIEGGKLHCLNCDYECEVDSEGSEKGSGGSEEGSNPEKGKESKSEEGSEGSSPEKGKESKSGKGKESKSGKGSGEGSDEEGSKSDEEGSDEEGSDEEGSEEEGSEGGGGSKSEEEGSRPEKEGGSQHGNGPVGGKVSKHDDQPATGWDVVAQDILAALEAGQETGLLDNNKALGEALGEEKFKEDRSCLSGEAPYRPGSREADRVDVVTSSRRGQADDESRVQLLLDQVRSNSNFLRARLRQIVRSMEQTSVEHGVRRGKGLSSRMFVDDKLALMDGRMPHRPEYDEDLQIDTSLAAVVVLDESGSMDSWLQLATSILLAITEPLDFLGYPTMALGFRDGRGIPGGHLNSQGSFRVSGSQIDMFKRFDEPFRAVKWRFANTRADGTTPMADGVQYGLEALRERTETHRVMFVVTDGAPNHSHIPVVRRQIRLARQAGIHVVGVGLGSSARYVTTLFPDHVYPPDMNSLPMALIRKLGDLLDLRNSRKGHTSPLLGV